MEILSMRIEATNHAYNVSPTTFHTAYLDPTETSNHIPNPTKTENDGYLASIFLLLEFMFMLFSFYSIWI